MDNMFEKEQLNSLVNSCQEEIRRLKNQQKEFIEYLTSYIDLLSNKPDLIEENQKDILEEILSKYKEIIEDKFGGCL